MSPERRAPMPAHPTEWVGGVPPMAEVAHSPLEHDLVPAEGEAGDWTHDVEGSDAEHRVVVCAEPTCGYVLTEGRGGEQPWAEEVHPTGG